MAKLKYKKMANARPEDGHKWIPFNRNLVKGDILRTPLDERDLKGPWLYGICEGSGFGCDRSLMGNAIFMRGESQDLNYVLSILDKPDEGHCEPPFTWRWEKRWLIEIMEK
jgi:hypothetical protein